jgi:CubicO group peptidase (beta-lactamase class C family)
MTMSELDLTLLERRVERLLAPWSEGDKPGMTVGVFQGGETLLHASAGLASLELGVPIGPDTRFRIASVSKQFTCAAILLLAAEGRLGLEDAVCDHIPAFPHPDITLAHLMHNTSGVRDMLELMRMGGADLGVACRSEDLMQAICRQRTLNFAPGSRFLYSNSNFLLLGRIAERVSGEPLGAFLEQRVFAPLGMTRTKLVESTTEVVPGLAAGYLPEGSGYIRAAHAFPLHGEGGLVSCVTDLALWERNFSSGRVGGAALGAALMRQTAFTNGTENYYARGLILRAYRGVRTVTHGGLWPGYKTEFLRVPEHELTIIAISNNGGADPGLFAHRVLDVLIEGRPGVRPPPPRMAQDALTPLLGRYLNRDTGATLEVEATPDGAPQLRSHGGPLAVELLPDGRLGTTRGIACVTLRAKDADTLEVEQDAGALGTWHRVTPGAVLSAGLAGRYVSEELAAEWEIFEQDGALRIRVTGPLIRRDTFDLEPIQGDYVRIHVPWTLLRAWLDARVLRDADGTVTGLVASGGRVKQMAFRRAEP